MIKLPVLLQDNPLISSVDFTRILATMLKTQKYIHAPIAAIKNKTKQTHTPHSKNPHNSGKNLFPTP